MGISTSGPRHGHQHSGELDEHRRHAHEGLRPFDESGGDRHRHRRPARRRYRRSGSRERVRREEHRQQGRDPRHRRHVPGGRDIGVPGQVHAQGTSSMSSESDEHGGRMLLHACCGPCSLEPTRIFAQEGVDFAIHYANSNIFPPEEYEHRLSTLREHVCDPQDIELIEGDYDPERLGARGRRARHRSRGPLPCLLPPALRGDGSRGRGAGVRHDLNDAHHQPVPTDGRHPRGARGGGCTSRPQRRCA